jgi:hypothetical protein
LVRRKSTGAVNAARELGAGLSSQQVFARLGDAANNKNKPAVLNTKYRIARCLSMDQPSTHWEIRSAQALAARKNPPAWLGGFIAV